MNPVAPHPNTLRRQRAAWLIWAVLLVVSIAAVPALNERAAGTTSHPAGTAAARFGFRLDSAGDQAGVRFVHEGPTFDSKLEPIMPQVASMGASVTVADFDRDGWDDFYVTNSREGSLNRLYRNKGDGTFEDVAAAAGVADVNGRDTGVSMGAVWGDYDNDDYEDLFLYRYGRPEIFHNEGGRRFVPLGARSGLPAWVNANSATWLDYDRDGRLDLFLAGYWHEDVNLWQLPTTRIMPESFEYANNGGRKYLLWNRGDGTFEDRTARLGINSRRWTLAVAAADLLGTGYPDLFLANDYGVSELYANRAGTSFVDVGRETGLSLTPKSGMNASFGDVFNDGRLAIYKTNISEPGVLVQGNDLWVPRTRAEGPPAYENLASSLGVELGGWSWGAQFGDLNNDGNLDLYLVNGYVSAGERSSYWYDFSAIAVGHSAIIADAKNWPPMRGRSLSGYQRKRVWLNDGLGRFTEVAQVVGATDTYDGRAVALADLSNRGSLDVLVANQRGPLLVYRNTTAPDRHWIQFALEGSASNRSAIGARVELQWDGGRQMQEVMAASGFSAQNGRRLHFGLGARTTVERAIVRWPSGRTETIERPAIDRLHRLRESHAG
ncbi:MAG TPA: CRTAC1 family protein [Vicinamibacterales bacterium]|nr:CRTAC1 family protein [Vicinamibacterales bacterium]